MTKRMKNKVDIDNFLHLIFWVKTFRILEGKKFNYQNLLDQAETYKLKNTPLDTKIHRIDDLMIDAFQIYNQLKSTEAKVDKVLDEINNPFFDRKAMKEETQKYERTFEDLIENYKYDDPEVRGIQMGILNEKMKEYIAVEDYENAARVRDLLKEC